MFDQGLSQIASTRSASWSVVFADCSERPSTLNCLMVMSHPVRLVNVPHLAAVGDAAHHLMQSVVGVRVGGRAKRLQQLREHTVRLHRQPGGETLLAAELAAVEKELVLRDHLAAAQCGEHLVSLRVVLGDLEPGQARLHMRTPDDVVFDRVQHGDVRVVGDEADDDLHVHEKRPQLDHLLR